MPDLQEDKLTLDQSNSGESEQQADDDTTQVDDAAGGNATDDNSTADDATTDTEEEQKPRGERRHERYIDKLSKEIQEHNSTDSGVGELFTPKPYDPIKFEEGAEYDPKQLEEDRKAVEANKFAEGIAVGRREGVEQINSKLWETNFDIDGERVMAKYEDKLTPDIEQDLVQGYISFIGMTKDEKGRISIQKPNVRFKDYAEAEFAKMERYADLRQAESSDNIVKQAAKTGTRPTSQGRSSTAGHGFDPDDPAGSVKRMTSKQYNELGGREASDAWLAKRGLGPSKT